MQVCTTAYLSQASIYCTNEEIFASWLEEKKPNVLFYLILSECFQHCFYQKAHRAWYWRLWYQYSGDERRKRTGRIVECHRIQRQKPVLLTTQRWDCSWEPEQILNYLNPIGFIWRGIFDRMPKWTLIDVIDKSIYKFIINSTNQYINYVEK